MVKIGAAGRRIRAGFFGGVLEHCMQRVHAQNTGTVFTDRIRDFRQVRQVADTLVFIGTLFIQLNGNAPSLASVRNIYRVIAFRRSINHFRLCQRLAGNSHFQCMITDIHVGRHIKRTLFIQNAVDFAAHQLAFHIINGLSIGNTNLTVMNLTVFFRNLP